MHGSRVLGVLVFFGSLLLPHSLCSQSISLSGMANGTSGYLARNLEVNVKTAEGKPIDGQVLIQLITVTGRLYAQATARNGRARFNSISKDEFRILVTAPGYQRGESRVDLSTNNKLADVVDILLVPIADAEDASSAKSAATMNPKTQKELSKAVEALRAKRPADARSHLQAAQKTSPDSADVEYVFGLYSSRMNDPAQAVAHWNRALTFDPRHLSALLELAQELINEKRPADASTCLQRALQVEPSSWRAHAFSAEAAYLLGNRDEAIKQAERAIELGHDRAAAVQPFLAGVFVENGNTDQGIQIMRQYVKANPSDAASAKELEQWENPAPVSVRAAARLPVSAEFPLPPNWMPPDVDEKIPPVDQHAVCSLDDLLAKSAEELTTLVHDVDRFTATELITDETINKYGLPSASEKQRFAYTVSIQEMRPGMLTVDEYRSNESGHTEFPDGVITAGLPALVLVFHPFYASNYEMTCEGLARWNGSLAWQVHFRQRPDKPIQLRGFRVGALGVVHPAALRGRAWIAADTNQIVRLETDLVAPIPEIRLAGEHIAIEYGAVNFRKENIELWLPRSAEVHFDWRGQRVHRLHSFDNYLLFSIEENERIGAPKGEKQPADSSSDTLPPS